MKEDILTAIKLLRSKDPSVAAKVRDGKQWFHVDETLLVSWAEMNDLAEGVFSVAKLEDLHRRRTGGGTREHLLI
jgi:hypothetical protein